MRSQPTYINKWARLCILCFISLVLYACGGSREFDIPEPITDTTSPSVESFYPNDDASEDFEVDFKVEITFTEQMNQESLVNEGGIKLYSGKNELDSEFDIEERATNISFSVVPIVSNDLVNGKEIVIPATKATLTHSSGRFALNTEYTVIIDSPARDLVADNLDTEEDERNYISSSNTVDFTTEEGEWKQVKSVPNMVVEDKGTVNESLLNVSANQFSPKLIANAKGDTFLIWRQELTSGINQLWVSRYIADTKRWGLSNKSEFYCTNDNCANSHLISEITSTSVIDYDVSINEQGHLAVAWSQAKQQGEFVSIWASIFDGKVWNSISEISDTGFLKTGNTESPSIALDAYGNAVSIWREHDGQYSRIKTNIFKVGAGSDISSGQWVEAPIFIDSHSQLISKNPKLSMSSQGFAIAVWEQKESSISLFEIFSNHIRLYQGNDWVGSERINKITSTSPEFGIGNSSLPSIAIDQNNDAIAVWLKHDGQRNNVWFNRFTGSWGELSNYLEESRLGDASYPSITIGKNNRALAYWVQENTAGNSRSLFSSFFTAFTGWESGRLMATNSIVTNPTAKFDREGNAVIIWQEGLIKGELNSRYYSKLTDTWGREEELDRSGANVSLTPLLEDGRFLTTWIDEQNSQYRLESVLFSD